jgi:thiol-disulfide isomerase/thioredoxin
MDRRTFLLAAAGLALKPWAGGPAPALALPDLQGREHRLAQYRGKVVLINFWATWCEPCREEMPSIERLRGTLQDRPFAVLAVNLAEGEQKVRAFLERVPVRFTVLLDADGGASRAWRARLLPATFIVGPDGAVRYSYVGALDWSMPAVRDAIQSLMQDRA